MLFFKISIKKVCSLKLFTVRKRQCLQQNRQKRKAYIKPCPTVNDRPGLL